jgi:hypothetical protein
MREENTSSMHFLSTWNHLMHPQLLYRFCFVRQVSPGLFEKINKYINKYILEIKFMLKQTFVVSLIDSVHIIIIFC